MFSRTLISFAVFACALSAGVANDFDKYFDCRRNQPIPFIGHFLNQNEDLYNKAVDFDEKAMAFCNGSMDRQTFQRSFDDFLQALIFDEASAKNLYSDETSQQSRILEKILSLLENDSKNLNDQGLAQFYSAIGNSNDAILKGYSDVYLERHESTKHIVKFLKLFRDSVQLHVGIDIDKTRTIQKFADTSMSDSAYCSTLETAGVFSFSKDRYIIPYAAIRDEFFKKSEGIFAQPYREAKTHDCF